MLEKEQTKRPTAEQAIRFTIRDAYNNAFLLSHERRMEAIAKRILDPTSPTAWAFKEYFRKQPDEKSPSSSASAPNDARR